MTQSIPRHLEYPRLRPVQAFPVEHEGRIYLALHDHHRLTERACLLSQAGVAIAERFDGANSVSDLAAAIGIETDQLRVLVSNLDELGLLAGPTFEAMLDRLQAEFDARPRLPIRAAADVDQARIERALAEADDVSAARIAGLVVPHLDFRRGRGNYAQGYRALVGQPRPDRVIVLGTNHFGRSTGVVVCDRGYETNLGPMDVDRELHDALVDRLGEPLRECRLDHAREHSVELQMPWLRHAFGDVPVLGVLVHDPTCNNGESYDGRGISLHAFVDALREELDRRGGETLIVASADLSHVGPEFGDDAPNTPERLAEVESHDRKHLSMLESRDLQGFLESMTESRNPTRWCTLGGMAALWMLCPDAKPRLLRYEPAADHPSQGVCCVTSAAMVLEVDS